jgi:diguanylate cyclase (GGDEF)-like protein
MKKNQKTLKITIAYGVLNLVWLLLSSRTLANLSDDMGMMQKLDQYRGYFHIILSTSFLYFIINNMETSYMNTITSLKAKNIVLKQEMASISMKLDFNEYTNRKLAGYANTDELTGLYNRRRGICLIKEQMEQAADNEDTVLIAFIDIDNLKIINDKYGHIEGDILLASAARIISDSFSRKDIICRYGGDEFLVALPGASKKNIQVIKKRLDTAISNYNAHSFKRYAISLSIGFSEFNNKEYMNVEELIQEADENMYHNKASKKLSFVSNFK